MSVLNVGLGSWEFRDISISPFNLCLRLSVDSVTLCISPLLVLVPLALVLALAISLGSSKHSEEEEDESMEKIEQILATEILSRVPTNLLSYPVTGSSYPADGCGDSSVRYRNDGRCYPLLKRGPCPGLAWMTVDPADLSGQCTPRLCGKERVFNGDDGLCHDIYDALECKGGRRFYYTAFGDPICDCPIGQFPFPGPSDDCVPLFTRGPCPFGFVVGILSSGFLGCAAADCPVSGGRPQLLRHQADDVCYALGSQGPCSQVQRYGYDVFAQRGQCVDVNDPDTPYGLSFEEGALLDLSYNQLYEYEPVRVVVFGDRQDQTHEEDIDRQSGDSVGIFQLPESLSDPLLVPCRAGARIGNNYKCTNPLVPRPRSSVKQAVRPALACSQGLLLTAPGVCRPEGADASCGPSYKFIAALGQCRQTLATG